MEPRLLRLADILMNSEQFNWSDRLCCEPVFPYTKDTKATVLPGNYDERELDDEEDPVFAIKNNLKYTLSMQTVQGIVTNARRQKTNPTSDELVSALNYYIDRDTFIEFPKEKP